MSNKYYIGSVHDRLINEKKYINCFKKQDKQELKAAIKYVEKLLDPKIILSRNDAIKMMDKPNLFLQTLINKIYTDIGDQDIPISMGAKRSKKKSLKSKSKRKMKKSKRRK